LNTRSVGTFKNLHSISECSVSTSADAHVSPIQTWWFTAN
jgi:hypothetical protein